VQFQSLLTDVGQVRCINLLLPPIMDVAMGLSAERSGNEEKQRSEGGGDSTHRTERREAEKNSKHGTLLVDAHRHAPGIVSQTLR
jgi:hypothetical protein